MNVRSALKVCWFLFNKHGGLMNTAIATKLTLGFFLLLIRFQYYESSSLEVQELVYGTIWVIVLAVSSVCCYLYFNLIRPFPFNLLLRGQCGRIGLVLLPVAIFFGILSCYAFCREVWRVHAKVEEMQFPLLLIVLLYTAGVFWIMHRTFATVFLALVLLLRKLWMEQLDYRQRNYLFELFPWQVFVLLHIAILFSTFHGSFLSDFPHILCLGFHLCETLWLFALEYQAYSHTAPPWRQEAVNTSSEREVVTGIDRLRTKTTHYPPKSHVITGISRWHHNYAFDDTVEQRLSESRPSEPLSHTSLLHEYFLAYYRELL